MNTNPEPGSTPPIDAEAEHKILLEMLAVGKDAFNNAMNRLNGSYSDTIIALIHGAGMAFDESVVGMPPIMVMVHKMQIKKTLQTRIDLRDDER